MKKAHLAGNNLVSCWVHPAMPPAVVSRLRQEFQPVMLAMTPYEHVNPGRWNRILAWLLVFCGIASIPSVAFADFGFPPPANLTTTQGILRGVMVTLAVELTIVSLYCYKQRAPSVRCLIAGLIGNLLTLPAVWFVSFMGWFFLAHIGVFVFVLVELAAGIVESPFYHFIGGLDWRKAVWLGLAVNVVTAGLGVIDQALNVQQKHGPPRLDSPTKVTFVVSK